nr:MAG TPA: hypothetical protein [Microviridae sp.]
MLHNRLHNIITFLNDRPKSCGQQAVSLQNLKKV